VVLAGDVVRPVDEVGQPGGQRARRIALGGEQVVEEIVALGVLALPVVVQRAD